MHYFFLFMHHKSVVQLDVGSFIYLHTSPVVLTYSLILGSDVDNSSIAFLYGS